jgi:hypothetical protein
MAGILGGMAVRDTQLFTNGFLVSAQSPVEAGLPVITVGQSASMLKSDRNRGQARSHMGFELAT